jgi:Zn-dependent peptidase ImmA (M78 family)
MFTMKGTLRAPPKDTIPCCMRLKVENTAKAERLTNQVFVPKMSTMPATAQDTNIIGRRLRQAREMRGLSLRSLSEAIEESVSYNALNKYEKGAMLPGSSVLKELSNALQMPRDYFFRPFAAEMSNIKFRALSKVGQKTKRSLAKRAADFFERYLEVEQVLGIKTKFSNPLSAITIRTEEDVEKAALTLRDKWKLGLDAIPNVHQMLEDQGIKVWEAKDAPQEFNGMSGWMDGVPLVVLAGWLDSNLPRKRLTAMHELAHLLLDDLLPEDIPKADEERFMNRFANCFLIPKPVFVREFGGKRKRVSLEELIDIKLEFGISIAAIIRRAFDLNLITESAYTRFQFVRNKWGRKNNEPGDERYCGSEKSTRFSALVHRAVAQEVISASKAAALLQLPISEFKGAFRLFS